MSLLAAVLLALGDPAATPPPRPEPPSRIVLTMPAPRDASAPIATYAERERASTDLEEFRGGSEGLLVLIVVVAAVLILLAILIPW